MINTPSTLVYVKLQKYRNTKKHAHDKCPQHPGVRETAPSLGSCLGNRLPAWVSIRVSLVSSPFILFSLLSLNIVTIYLCNRPFWLLVRSIYDSFKYQGLVILVLPVLKMLINMFLFRHFQYFSSASPWPATWSASYLSLYTGCSSRQAPMSGSSMSGTQVAPRHKLRFPINASFFQKRAFAFRRCSFGFSLFT